MKLISSEYLEGLLLQLQPDGFTDYDKGYNDVLTFLIKQVKSGYAMCDERFDK